jgi:hypothetical protein
MTANRAVEDHTLSTRRWEKFSHARLHACTPARLHACTPARLHAGTLATSARIVVSAASATCQGFASKNRIEDCIMRLGHRPCLGRWVVAKPGTATRRAAGQWEKRRCPQRRNARSRRNADGAARQFGVATGANLVLTSKIQRGAVVRGASMRGGLRVYLRDGVIPFSQRIDISIYVIDC